MKNMQKAAIIGCGFVGSSIAFNLMQSEAFSELVLIDANTDRAEGRPWTSPTVCPLPTP